MHTMNNTFWARMHGGATHFPFALLLLSVLFDHTGFWWPNEPRRRELCAVGFYSLPLAAAAAPFAVLSGLALSKRNTPGAWRFEVSPSVHLAGVRALDRTGRVEVNGA